MSERFDTERFKKIEKHIFTKDGLIDRSTFNTVDWEACGTTRCVAGWAIYDETGSRLFDELGEVGSSVSQLADRLGVEVDFESVAVTLLGLPEDLAGLFYASSATAAEFVRRAARGDSVESVRGWFQGARYDG